MDIACYLVNRSPSSALEDKTPQEVWTRNKPSLSHLRVFVCDAYVHVPKEKRTKLNSKFERLIFIGYNDGLKVISFGTQNQGRLCTIMMWCLET